MTAGQLIRFLEEFDEDEEVAIDVSFPQIGWEVRDYCYVAAVGPDYGEPVLRAEVWEGDFDFPDVLRRLKARVDAIPEWAMRPRRRPRSQA